MVADCCVGLHLVSCMGTMLSYAYATQVLPSGEFGERNRLHASLLWLGILYWAWALLMALVYETRMSADLDSSADDPNTPLPLYVPSKPPQRPKTDKSEYQLSKKDAIPPKDGGEQERNPGHVMRVAEVTSYSRGRERLVWHSNGALSSVLALSSVVYVWALQGSLREILRHYCLYSWNMGFGDQMLLVCLPTIFCSLEIITALIYLLQLLGFMPIDELPENSKMADTKIAPRPMAPSAVNSCDLKLHPNISADKLNAHMTNIKCYL